MSQQHSGPGLILFRIFLCLGGLFIVFTGLDFSLGGIMTMGWQTSGAFLAVTDADAFAAQDNHVRFIGGVWLAVGLLLLLGAVCPRPMKPVLYACFFAIFVGGLARLSAADMDILFGPEVLGSLALELIGMPLVAYWLSRLKLD
ncbi:DUF4345 domain-containing protein [Minwuia sp.]|uniref:DUF4345 domain-containing protein n=1 Tax=Minwuia sp. TaxID=2493630 RepID=UPI003A8D5449